MLPSLIEDASSSSICPNCQKNVGIRSIYCGNCGFHLTNHIQHGVEESHCQSSSLNTTPWDQISPAIKLWITLLAIYGIFGIAGRLTDTSSPSYDLCASSIAGIIILVTCIKARSEILPLLNPISRNWYFIIIETMAAFILIAGFMYIYLKGASYLGVTQLKNLVDYKENGWPIWSAFILISIMPAIFEELAFRGYIMSKLEKVGNTMEALLIQAAMFSILHLLPAIFISHFVMGLVFGFIRIRNKSLYPCIILHASWNAFIVTKELIN